MNTSNLKVNSLVMLEIPSVAEKFQISSPLRLAHFLAQCSHESGDFKAIEFVPLFVPSTILTELPVLEVSFVQ